MSYDFIKLTGIEKSFGGVKALQGVSMSVKQGEIRALAGENGSGKSTLIKIISGVYQPTAGRIEIEGEEFSDFKPIDAINKGIQVVYQDFAVFPNLTVAENIAMNSNIKSNKKIMSWKKTRRIALEAMAQIGADLDPDLPLVRLTVAKKQLVAICRAIISDAKLLILDEPTTALTAKEVEYLNDILRKLKKKGLAIVIVNHKLDEIYEIADTLTIIRNGKLIADGNIGEFDRARFVKALTGRNLEDQQYRPSSSTQEIFKVEHFTKKGAFEDVSFSLQKGDVLGLTGLLGSGRGEIGDALFGLEPAQSGTIMLNGKTINVHSVKDAVSAGIGYVPEDRLTQGLFMERSIQDNTVASNIKKYLNHAVLDYRRMYDDTVQWIKRVNCKAPGPEPPIRTLSGGNAQKMVIAKWLNTDPKLLILNGPTVGIDVGSKADIFIILHDLAKQGVGIIVISDDISELIENCNKILVMREGRPSPIYESNDLDSEKLAKLLNGAILEDADE
ncbi:MAG: sugar ABC transporter ATP-binding protein [Bifidobacteriales bacterium]|nr:sugar ABC transporter ATP-binding protein [Bifidobacteriales bacterium]